LNFTIRWAGLAFFICYATSTAQQPDQISIPDAIALALNNNPKVITAQREIDAASAKILRAGRIPNPEIEVSWEKAPSLFKIGTADEMDITVRQDIEFPTKRSSRIDVAETDRKLAELRLNRIETIVASEVRKAYYRILLTQRNVENLEAQSMIVQDFLDLAGYKLRSGAGNYLDVIRTKVELARLGNDILEAKKGWTNELRSFNILLGREHDTPLTLTDSLVGRPVPLNVDSIMNDLPARSALVEATFVSINRHESVVDMARLSYLPDFSFSLSSQRRSGRPPVDVNGLNGTTSYGIGLSLGLSVPLWFWQEPTGQVQEAIARASIAEIDHASILRGVRSSVRTAVGMVEAAENQIRVFDRSLLADLEDILSTAIDHYRNNQIDIMNLLDVYRTNRTALVEYNRVLLNYWTSRADLDASAELPLSIDIE